MNPRWLATVVALVSAACAQGPEDAGKAAVAPAPAVRTVVAESVPDAAVLGAYHWRLSRAVDAGGGRIDALFVSAERPVQLDFTEGRLVVGNTCNRLSGGFSVDGTRIEIGRLASTMMACADEALMALDREIGGRLEGGVSFATRVGDAVPELILTSGAGDVLTFTGHPTAATRFGGPGEIVFLEIAAQTRPCGDPEAPERECLEAREIAFDEQGLRRGTPGEWRPLDEGIEGFVHTPGVRNVLRVRRFQRDPSGADASATAYVLDLVVESEVVQPTHP
jgi:hypothetical protein